MLHAGLTYPARRLIVTFGRSMKATFDTSREADPAASRATCDGDRTDAERTDGIEHRGRFRPGGST